LPPRNEYGRRRISCLKKPTSYCRALTPSTSSWLGVMSVDFPADRHHRSHAASRTHNLTERQ
jgi:hypothetical protein